MGLFFHSLLSISQFGELDKGKRKSFEVGQAWMQMTTLRKDSDVLWAGELSPGEQSTGRPSFVAGTHYGPAPTWLLYVASLLLRNDSSTDRNDKA